MILFYKGKYSVANKNKPFLFFGIRVITYIRTMNLHLKIKV